MKAAISKLPAALLMMVFSSLALFRMAYACDYGAPIAGSICITAWYSKNTVQNQQFVPADGRSLSTSDFTQLYAIIGLSYTSNRTAGQFDVPNLQGRFVLGAGRANNNILYPLASTGGQAGVNLTSANLPAHQHTINTSGQTAQFQINTSQFKATTTWQGVSATTTLNNMAASINNLNFSPSAASLTLNGASGTPTNQPSGHALGSALIYSGTAPSIAMQAGSISGSLNGNLSGSAPLTMTGNPATILSGGTVQTTVTGSSAVNLKGSTETSGGSNVISTMPPYIALRFYIATKGIQPQPN